MGPLRRPSNLPRDPHAVDVPLYSSNCQIPKGTPFARALRSALYRHRLSKRKGLRKDAAEALEEQQRPRLLHVRREEEARVRSPEGAAREGLDQALRRLLPLPQALRGPLVLLEGTRLLQGVHPPLPPLPGEGHPRTLAAHAAQRKQKKEEEQERLMLQKAREIDAFYQQNHGAVPHYIDRGQSQDKSGFHGANSVKTTTYEEEALRTMKAFWLPSATPDAPTEVEAPPTSTVCPEGKEKLKLKSLFPVHFTEDTNERKKPSSLDKTYICPSCKVTLTNTLSLSTLSSCGHVFCKKCAEKFIVADKVCLVCDKPCKGWDLVKLEKGGTGFSGHGDHLEATDFKHLGSGSGLGLVRPAAKT